MAGSDSSVSAAGSARPREPCMQPVESSIDTDCSPLAWRSISMRPRQGSRYAVLPCTRWLRFSLVEICTVSGTARQAASIWPWSGTARTRLPPRLINACSLPALIASHISTVFMPLARGGSKPYSSFSLSSGASSGFSVMPTVRCPCTFEWPRTGQMPAPGLPIFPRNKRKLTSICTFSTPLRCCVRPMP